MSTDDREHIRQQRRAERERKEREFQEEMERWEAERKARLEARKKQRELEEQAEASKSAQAAQTAAPANPAGRRALRRVETIKQIEQSLDSWENDRKERLSEREQEALERKKALEMQLALEEAERKAKAEERRRQRELERQREEEEEQARKRRLEERRLAREAQRIQEEKEYQERLAQRRKNRETLYNTSSPAESSDSSKKDKDSDSSKKDKDSDSSKKDKESKSDSKKDKKEKEKSKRKGSIPAQEIVQKNLLDEAKAKEALDSQLLGEYFSLRTSSPVVERGEKSSSDNSSLHSSNNSSNLNGSNSNSPTSAPAAAHPPLRSNSPCLDLTTRSDSPVRRKRLGELKRATDTLRSSSELTKDASPTSSPTISLHSSQDISKSNEHPIDDMDEDEKKEKERLAQEALKKARKEKEEKESELLKKAAEAELAAQEAQDNRIREEMRREEEALLAKEELARKEAEKAAKAQAKPATPSLLSKARASQKSRLPTKERPIGYVTPPISHRLTVMEVFCVGGGGVERVKRQPDPELLLNHFLREGRLSRDCCTEILLQIRTALLYEKNVLTVPAPAHVIGDIHGQFYDLVHMIKETGIPGSGESNFVFLGDYVDRGTFSCEVCLFLFACKLRYPKKVFLLRGNHETRAMSSYHNFQKEATHKYGESIYEMFMEVFDHLPLAAVVEAEALGRVFCCHGGLSPSFKTIDEIQEIDRVSEPPDEGGLCDLIWADPVENDKFFNQNFSRNKERGCSVLFGYNPIYDFLEANNLVFIVRAHQVEEKGYRELHFSQAPPGRAHPMVITVFSAPNYCDSYENMAAYLTISHDEYNYRQYTWQEHPYCLPEFSNAFKFSMPFVAENIIKFLFGIVETVNALDIEESEDELKKADDEAAQSMEQKIRNVGKAFVQLKKLREQRMSQLGNIVEQMQKNKQPGALVSGETLDTLEHLRSKGGRRKVQRVVSDLSEIVRAAHNRFQTAKEADRDNERFHGRAAWKSNFRKLGRGVSFKV